MTFDIDHKRIDTFMNFKRYFEATDIFGFDKTRNGPEKDDNMLSKPINQFDVELMMDLLAEKSIQGRAPTQPFISEIQWGNGPGAVKLEVDTGYTFHIKKLNNDKQGSPRWIHKKMFQLNRSGYGGLEDVVAGEIFEHLSKYYEGSLEGPNSDPYIDLEKLVHHCYRKLKKIARDIFIPEGIKQVSDHAYIIQLGVRGGGVEAPSQRRVEQNQTMFTYDPEAGTIRVFNYNVESGTGNQNQWRLMENDLDLYFFPSQTRDEIADCLAVHFKFY